MFLPSFPIATRSTGSSAGFSLVELMIAMAVNLVIMAGVFGLMVENQNVYEQQTRLADVQQAARIALDLITRDVRAAGADPSGRAFGGMPPGCATATYKLPASPATPLATDVAPLTEAEPTKIRVKGDRPTFALGAEPYSGPGPAEPPYGGDCSGDGYLISDDEHGLGDGFLNDEAEDVEYEWVAASQELIRREYRDDPDSTCRCPGAMPSTPVVTEVIADHVVQFAIKYFDTDPPTAACPAPGSLPAGYNAAAYEAARDTCDPPLANPVPDKSRVRRVRIHLVVETDLPDRNKPRVAPKFGKTWVSLVSEAMVRNRGL